MTGIYPDRKFIPISTGYMEEVTTPGVVLRRELTAGDWVEDREDCFCCSCDDGASDASCRNHGYYGRRPCDFHQMPGQEDDEGNMPLSIQKYRGA